MDFLIFIMVMDDTGNNFKSRCKNRQSFSFMADLTEILRNVRKIVQKNL